MTDADELRTEGGYQKSDVMSALQKEIRRGKEEEALFWAIELETLSYPQLWQRLEIIASEDIGLANPIMSVRIRILKDQYFEAAEKRNPGYRVFLAHAILQLCRSEKSRLVDDFLWTVYQEHADGKKLKVPDYALGGHSVRGKTAEESEKLYDMKFKLENESFKVNNPYKERAKKHVLAHFELPEAQPKKGKNKKSEGKTEDVEEKEKPSPQKPMDQYFKQ